MEDGTAETPTLLDVRDLAVRFRRGEHVVQSVDGVSFTVNRGEMPAVVGESGSGKSVAARAIMRLLPRTATLGPRSRIVVAGTRIEKGERGADARHPRQAHRHDL